MIPNETKVAWLGAGTMGAAMAANLAKAGYRVSIWSRTKPSAGLGVAAAGGCAIARTVEEALSGSQFVCSCVTDGPALRSILFAPGRSLKTLVAKDAVVVDFSTIGPVEARSISQQLVQAALRF